MQSLASRGAAPGLAPRCPARQRASCLSHSAPALARPGGVAARRGAQAQALPAGLAGAAAPLQPPQQLAQLALAPQPLLELGEGLETPIQLIYLTALLGFLSVGAYLVARQVLIRRELDEAAKALGERIRTGEATCEDYYELGVILTRKKLFTQATKNLEKAKKSWDGEESDLAQVHNALGFCYFSMEKTDMAIAEYKRAVELQQGYVTAWNNLGDAYERSKDWRNAMAAYQEALAYAPNNKIAMQRGEFCKQRVERLGLAASRSASARVRAAAPCRAVAAPPGHPVPARAWEKLDVMPSETIQDIRLRLNNNGWFSAKSCLVFGDRELADAVRVSDLVAESGKEHPSYLHVFVKLADVESVNISTPLRALSLDNPAAAEQHLAESLMRAASSSNLLALPAVAEPAPDAAPAPAAEGAGDAACRAIVHLMVHKSAKVSWHHLQANRFELTISSSDTVESLMRKIEAANGRALEPSALLVDGEPAPRAQPLVSISRDAVLELVPLEPEEEALPAGSPSLASPAHQLHAHWKAAQAGLAEGREPVLAPAGTGGSYFLSDAAGRRAAIFKPCDEEPLAANNPKGRTPGSSSDGSGGAGGGAGAGSEGMRRGTRPGEGAAREVAAFLLDHGHFAGVPPTALVSAYVSGGEAAGAGGAVKVGSLQAFVESEGDCEERGVSGFPVHQVHKIAALDLRLANADRNAGNILCRRDAAGEFELIPIDHGYCFPASFEDISFDWAMWPQAAKPWSEEARAYIASLDAEADVALLAAHGIALRPECLRVFRVCTMVLQKGAAAGLTPAQIAGLMCRSGLTKSALEKLHSNAVHLARAEAAAAAKAAGAGARRPEVGPLYMRHMAALLDELMEEAALDGGADLLF
ncbi:PI4KG4 [Scenedesmus sp. PABB004]|nr:PI4KG4 [Scenedesmus sp. PABB004]